MKTLSRAKARPVYEWINGVRLHGVNPQVVGEALDALQEKLGNELLTPNAVLEAARPKSSPLHAAFTWDDTEAARKHRLAEAALLIRSVRVRFIDRKGNALAGPAGSERAFFRITTEDKGAGYASSRLVATVQDYAEAAERECERYLRGAQQKIRDFQKVAKYRGVLVQIDELIEKELSA